MHWFDLGVEAVLSIILSVIVSWIFASWGPGGMNNEREATICSWTLTTAWRRISKLGKALGRFMMALLSNGDDLIVIGSSLVHVPRARLNEISKVIQEHHGQEAERARLLGFVRRVV
jgi:hypothetical protein